jgi:hypothetical protein
MPVLSHLHHLLKPNSAKRTFVRCEGYVHEFVNHTQKEYARGDVHEHRAECLFSSLKPYRRVCRGVSKYTLPGYVGFFHCLRNCRPWNAFAQAERILQAALESSVASRAR